MVFRFIVREIVEMKEEDWWEKEDGGDFVF